MIREQWNHLKSMYIERQKEMLFKRTPLNEGRPRLSGGQPESSDVTTSPPAAIELGPRYPVGCLVFVKNLNPDTNKAVLRSLLASAFSAESHDFIHYVDYSKGLDSVSQYPLDTFPKEVPN
jgi:hypothetical protein